MSKTWSNEALIIRRLQNHLLPYSLPLAFRSGRWIAFVILGQSRWRSAADNYVDFGKVIRRRVEPLRGVRLSTGDRPCVLITNFLLKSLAVAKKCVSLQSLTQGATSIEKHINKLKINTT